MFLCLSCCSLAFCKTQALLPESTCQEALRVLDTLCNLYFSSDGLVGLLLVSTREDEASPCKPCCGSWCSSPCMFCPHDKQAVVLP